MKYACSVISLILFLSGAVMAFIVGLAFPENSVLALALAATGMVIGLLRIREDANPVGLVVATLALLLLPSAFSAITTLNIGKIVAGLLFNFAILMAPIALIISLKTLFVYGVGAGQRKTE